MQNRPPLRASHEKSPIKRVCFVTGDGAVSNHNQSYHTLRGPQILLTSANSHARSLWGPFRTDPICPIRPFLLRNSFNSERPQMPDQA
ncbi:hypothetical protein AVEN_244066-1 [Araneus ventricosus]|uniref:Uncharacterized protein n=1 Tax=Araneus ventricosus TaxID=182803 RepID=A0A4Y2WBN4_ARAVE|nr:hypothetical protein AVEN_51269-1 [Araneus ventricosus]GBO33630.1 hypothetical protein AVEN_244066-1 [Araneus ventricosus]